MTSETRAAFSRRLGVNRSTVNRWEAKGRLVMASADLVDVEASERSLAQRAENYRGGRAKGPAGNPAKSVAPPTAIPAPEVRPDPAEMAIEALGAVVRQIGAFAARSAIEFGAPLRVAYALDQAVSVQAAEIADTFLTEAGVEGFSGGWSILEHQRMTVQELDWQALAARAGEPLNLDEIEEWFNAHWPLPSQAEGDRTDGR